MFLLTYMARHQLCIIIIIIIHSFPYLKSFNFLLRVICVDKHFIANEIWFYSQSRLQVQSKNTTSKRYQPKCSNAESSTGNKGPNLSQFGAKSSTVSWGWILYIEGLRFL